MNTKTLLYIFKRLLLCALTILIVISITFFVAHAAPGDPFASEKGKTAEQIAALKERHGMSGSIFEQYTTQLRYMEQPSMLLTVFSQLQVYAIMGCIPGFIIASVNSRRLRRMREHK